MQDTASAMKVVALAAADAPSQAAAIKLAAAVRAAALGGSGAALPESLTKAASGLDLSALSQDPALQSAAVPLLQAAAAAGGASWPSVALVGAGSLSPQAPCRLLCCP